MKRRLALAAAAVLAGCASGHTDRLSDASGPGPAPMADAPPVGHPDAAPPPDATPPPDAPTPPPDAPTPPPDAPTPPADAPTTPADAPPDACVPVTTELLANPAFDLTPAGTGWNQTPIDPAYPIITSDGTFTAQSAPYKVWMGGFTGDDEGVASVTDVLYQDVTVPPGTTQLVLTGYYAVGTQETSTTTAYDTASMALTQTNGTPIEPISQLSNLTSTTTWTAFSYTFATNVAGRTVRLRLTSTNDSTNNTNFFFDTFSLKATHCP